MISILTRFGEEGKICLEDLALCLAAQIDDNFEWILLVRPSSHILKPWLASVVNSYELLSTKTKIIECSTDSRGALLNIGLRHSIGNYLVVVDDDDLVTSNFVKVFNSNQNGLPGKTKELALRTITAVKKYEVIDGPERFLAAKTRAEFAFAEKFSLANHYHKNSTPCCSLAWPVSVIREQQIFWDEELKTVEDWDFIWKMAPFVEFYDLPVCTAIYRLTENGSRSSIAETKKSWNRSESIVRERIMNQNFYIFSDPLAKKVSISEHIEKYAFANIETLKKFNWMYKLSRSIYRRYLRSDD